MRETADELMKLLAIIRSPSVPKEHKEMAEERIQQIKDAVEAKELVNQGVPEDRAYDVLYLLKAVNDPKATPEQRARAKLSLELIRKESSDVKSMRQSLIKEIRNGRPDNAKDISEYIQGKEKYQNKK